MNEVYKEIAGIINSRVKEMNKWRRPLREGSNQTTCNLCMEEDYCYHEIKLDEIEEIANNLAISDKHMKKALKPHKEA